MRAGEVRAAASGERSQVSGMGVGSVGRRLSRPHLHGLRGNCFQNNGRPHQCTPMTQQSDIGNRCTPTSAGERVNQ
ncbi:hypothetical protein FAGKG844_200008 [Frankia sp. AgKG'84/4]